MCGIAGIASETRLTSEDGRLVDAMLRSLAHRGPDDHHTVAASRAILGARRLAIIDLDTGRQPVSNEDGSIVASQNGETYNYVELRRELVDAGHATKTKGDTEVLVRAYEEPGSPALPEWAPGT